MSAWTYPSKVLEAMKLIGVTNLRNKPSGDVRPLLGTSHKTRLGDGQGVKTKVMYLSPHREAGLGFSMCPRAGVCGKGCINRTGRMVIAQNEAVRILKTAYLHFEEEAFFEQLDHEIRVHRRRSERADAIPAVRMDGTSDHRFERFGVMERHPDVSFYDYTKFPFKFRKLSANYHITFSLSEHRDSWRHAYEWMEAGYSAAVVVRTKAMAKAAVEAGSWLGFPTLSGDDNDIRFRDPAGHLVILYAKGGLGLRDRSGFVQDVLPEDLGHRLLIAA